MLHMTQMEEGGGVYLTHQTNGHSSVPRMLAGWMLRRRWLSKLSLKKLLIGISLVVQWRRLLCSQCGAGNPGFDPWSGN